MSIKPINGAKHLVHVKNSLNVSCLAHLNALQTGNEVHFYAEHDPAKILASTRNGSLIFREDEEGLYMEATIAPTSWGKDYHTLIKTASFKTCLSV